MGTPATELCDYIFQLQSGLIGYILITLRYSTDGNGYKAALLTSEDFKVGNKLQLKISHHGELQPCLSGNQNGGFDTGNACSSNYRSWIADGNGTQKGIPQQYGVTSVCTLQRQGDWWNEDGCH